MNFTTKLEWQEEQNHIPQPLACTARYRCMTPPDKCLFHLISVGLEGN